MMAPVPYSISTKLPTQIGIFSPLKGLVAYRPVKKPSFSIVARSSAFTDVWRILASLASASTRAGEASSSFESSGCPGARITAVAP